MLILLPSDGQATNELVSEGFGLSNGAQSTDGNLLSVELNRPLGEAEPLLDNSGLDKERSTDKDAAIIKKDKRLFTIGSICN